MIYFISDTHFNHKGSLLWNNGAVRPQFTSVDEMNELMIRNWNNTVKDNDIIYFLGDFAFKCNKNKAEAIFWVLKGEKHLIKGNHDYKIADKFVNCWASISDIKQVDYIEPTKGIKTEIICCHYPMLSWRHKEQGSIHLHGHVHGGIQELNKGTRRMDVSVECINYTPISIDEVVKRMANV
jgi:calcineurin-like phosphoesterase family protein